MNSDKINSINHSILRLKRHAMRVKLIFMSVDYLTANLAFFIFNYLRFVLLDESAIFQDFGQFVGSSKLILEQIFFPIIILGVYALTGTYNAVVEKSRVQEISSCFQQSVFIALFIFFSLLLDDRASILKANYLLLLLLLLTLWSVTFIGRLAVMSWNNHILESRNFTNNIIIIAKGDGNKIKKFLTPRFKRPIRNNVVKCININGNALETLKHIDSVCREYDVNQVLVSEKANSEEVLTFLLEKLFPEEISVKIMTSSVSYFSSKIKVNDVLSEPIIDVTSAPLSALSNNVKRCFDILLSILFLILLIPVYIILAVMIKAGSPGPVFYVQKRMGHLRKPFNIIKFRTMNVDSEPNGPQLSSENDERITKLGKILRKYRLDELPQFWNVLKGDMSLVGPRPEREYYVRQIVRKSPYYSLIFQIRPGITSWGMVKFGYASSVEQMVERARYDILYLGNMSVIMDLKIIIYTLRTLVQGRGM